MNYSAPLGGKGLLLSCCVISYLGGWCPPMADEPVLEDGADSASPQGLACPPIPEGEHVQAPFWLVLVLWQQETATAPPSLGTLVSYCLRNESPQTRWLKTCDLGLTGLAGLRSFWTFQERICVVASPGCSRPPALLGSWPFLHLKGQQCGTSDLLSSPAPLFCS